MTRNSHTPPVRTAIVMLGVFKGGSGKSALALALCQRASERNWRVLAVDTDRQADLRRRLTGEFADDHRPPATWAPSSWVICSPDTYDVERLMEGYDLVVIDTAPATSPPAGRPSPDLLLMPIDGVDAARSVRETIAGAHEFEQAPAAWVVLNKLDAYGKRYSRAVAQIEDQCPPDVSISAIRIPHGGAIGRSDLSGKPAWRDPQAGRPGRVLAEWADEVLDWLVANVGADQAAVPRRRASR